MAAERIKSVTASCSKTNNSFSYANAVLNFKNDDKTKPAAPEKNSTSIIRADQASSDQVDKCNKENERGNENVNKNGKIAEDSSKTEVDLSSTSVNNTEERDHGDDFIDYSGSKRKKKMAKMKKKDITLQSFVTAPPSSPKSIPYRPERMRPPPKRRDKVIVPFSSDEVEVDTASCDTVTYVEAPVPKVNPWTINRNAASVLKGESFPVIDDKGDKSAADSSKYYYYNNCDTANDSILYFRSDSLKLRSKDGENNSLLFIMLESSTTRTYGIV
jgi:hypothetical protein